MGARIVAIGKLALWGLAAGGAAGVDRTIHILSDEIASCLALCEKTSVCDQGPDLVGRAE